MTDLYLVGGRKVPNPGSHPQRYGVEIAEERIACEECGRSSEPVTVVAGQPQTPRGWLVLFYRSPSDSFIRMNFHSPRCLAVWSDRKDGNSRSNEVES